MDIISTGGRRRDRIRVRRAANKQGDTKLPSNSPLPRSRDEAGPSLTSSQNQTTGKRIRGVSVNNTDGEPAAPAADDSVSKDGWWKETKSSPVKRGRKSHQTGERNKIGGVAMHGRYGRLHQYKKRRYTQQQVDLVVGRLKAGCCRWVHRRG